MKMNAGKLSLYILILIGVGALFYYALRVEPNRLTVSTLDLRFKGAFPVRGSLKIVHLTDLHINEYGDLQERMIRTVNNLSPDIILITGDLVQSWSEPEPAVAVINALEAPLGVWVVLGNIDYKLTDRRRLLELLSGENVQVLSNRREKLTFGDFEFHLTGIAPYAEEAEIRETLTGADPALPQIVLVHWPYLIQQLLKFRPQLILTGHTHGGQFRLPLIGKWFARIITGTHYDAGLFRVFATRIYVSRGIGTSILPLRFLSPPEIVEINAEFIPDLS